MNIKLKDKDKIRISESEDIYGIMQRVLLRDNKIDQEKEHFWVVGLNQAGYLLHIELVSLGASAMAAVEPMNVFRIAIMKGAVRIVAVHNHPNGRLKPSEQEEDITDRLIQVGRIIDLQLDDHLVITTQSYLSFKETGLMDKLAQSTKYVPTYQLVERIRDEEKAIRDEMQKELLKAQEAQAKAQESQAKAQDAQAKAQEAQAKAQEAQAKAQEAHKRERQEKEKERQEKEKALEAQENERQERTRVQLALAKTQLALAQAERDKIQAEYDKMQAEHDKMRAERDKMQAEREQILVKKRLARSLYSKGVELPDIAEMMLITIKDVENLLKGAL